MKQYDLIVLGTGAAGQQVALTLKKEGWNVAVINDGIFGSTCAVRGCIPKKVLAGTAEIADVNCRMHELGIVKEPVAMDWAALMAHKRSFTDPVPPRTEQSLKDAGIDVYKGAPRFTGNLQITVNDEVLQAGKVYIAVGAKPAKLPIEGAELLITSDDFLELDNLPKNIVFVGGGYISFELAHVAARLGAKVTILHRSDRPLTMFDADVIDTLLAASADVGIQVELNAPVQKITKNEGGSTVWTADGRSFDADIAVHGAGRPPAVDELNLEATGVDYDSRKGVLVDEYLRSTTNGNVYAAGDVAASGPPLSPVADIQGGIVMDNLLGKERKQPSYLSTPSVIFSTPTVARVGYLESEARENGLDFETITTDLTGWFDTKRLNLKHAMSKVLVEKGTKKIIGAHLIGNHAEDIINIFSLAVELGLTTGQLKAPIFAFPTTSDDMRSMF